MLKRLKDQAELQISSEDKNKPDFKILPHDNLRSIGLSLLPPNSDFDVFFDLEGFPHIEGGLEYLWGATYFNKLGERKFIDFWAHNSFKKKKHLQILLIGLLIVGSKNLLCTSTITAHMK